MRSRGRNNKHSPRVKSRKGKKDISILQGTWKVVKRIQTAEKRVILWGGGEEALFSTVLKRRNPETPARAPLSFRGREKTNVQWESSHKPKSSVMGGGCSEEA